METSLADARYQPVSLAAMRVIVHRDPPALAEAAARELASILGSGESVTIGLAGGSTPRATYERLREIDLPWDRIHGWLADERWVSEDDPNSNARMVRQALFAHVPGYLHVPDCGPGRRPPEAAAEFEQELATFMDRPDVVLLGIGADGHTASLFPGTDALGVVDRDYVANRVSEHDDWRLTATIPLLHRARRLIFLVSGEAKAPALRAILDERQPLPAGVVAAGPADVTWLLDREAALALDATQLEHA